MPRPRLAVVTPYFPHQDEPYRGQSAYQTLLRMQDWAEIEVFSPVATYPRWRLLQPKNFRYVRPPQFLPPAGMKATYLPYPALPAVSRYVNWLFAARVAWPAVASFRPDLILNYWLYPEGYAAVRIGRRLGVPVVVGSIGSDLRRISGGVVSAYTKQVLRQASGLLTVSEDLRQIGIGMGADPGRSLAILNGVDTETFRHRSQIEARARLGVGAGEQVLLYVGNLIPTKGLRELTEAVRRLRTSRPNLRLVCLGEGPMREELELAGQQAILLAGRADSAGVARWMAAADLFCLPSYSEGCPNVVVESLSCGCPVVATNVGGVPELLGPEAGVLVPARDASALHDGLELALNRAWNRQAIAASHNRTWDDCARETMEFCARFLHR